MSALPYFGDAYMADTRHLTLEEHGAYHLLLLIAWRSPNCALPDDDKRLAQMLGITGKKWAALKPTVMGFWTLTKAGWQQKRLTKERRWVEEKKAKNSDAANARWNAKPLENNEPSYANASANEHADAHANGYAPLPLPHKNSSEGKPSSLRTWPCPTNVDPDHWRDFLKNRKTRRLTNSETAYRGQLRELDRLSSDEWPPGRLVRHAAEKGWGSINDPTEPRYGTARNSGIGKSQAAFAELNYGDDEPF